MAKETTGKKLKKLTKAQVLTELVERTGLTRKQISELFEALRDLMKRELGKRGPEQFEIPGIVRFKVRRTEAQKGKKFRNPQTGEIVTKDVPASRKLRAVPVKALKDLVL
jgi:nucleoid DNA-binding protein